MLRRLFNQLKVSLNVGRYPQFPDQLGGEFNQAVKELTKILNESDYAQWKEKLLSGVDKVDRSCFTEV